MVRETAPDLAAETAPADAGLTTFPRAPARRPRVVFVDVLETMLRVDALSNRFVDVGRPADEWRLFFARIQRNGMALTLAGDAPPFDDVARATLRSLVGELPPEAVEHVLGGLRELPPHRDVEPALLAMTRARVPVYGFTHADPAVAAAALDRAGLRTYLREVLSTQAVPAFKPALRTYRWGCAKLDVPADRTAMLSVHSWDVHGAVRAGLVGALATRLEGWVPDVVDRPHVTAERLDDTVIRLLNLPA
jgi:2-haloacid dehalogenase